MAPQTLPSPIKGAATDPYSKSELAAGKPLELRQEATEGADSRESATTHSLSRHNPSRPTAPKEPQLAPGVLVWNPRLVTNSEGQAEIEFTLPATVGSYRVIVDAQADGRLGALETTITIPAP